LVTPERLNVGATVGITGGVGFLLLAVIMLLFLRRRKQNRQMRQLLNLTIPHPLPPPPSPPAVEFKSHMPPAGTLASKMQALVRQCSPSSEFRDQSTTEMQESQEQPAIPGLTNIDRIEAQLSTVLRRLAVLETAEADQAPPDYVSTYGPC
ncbi:hypothetical protein V5O48_015480, partial [Marasmius crinis-equi]